MPRAAPRARLQGGRMANPGLVFPGTDHSGCSEKNSASLIAMGQAIAGKPIT